MLKQFEQLPAQLHQQDENYVPPFPGSITKFFGPKSPFKAHGELFPFLAYRDGVPVGRIAAIVNHSHNRFYKDKTGFFGFFDCIEDETVSQALFRRVRELLAEKGCDKMRGPYSPSINDECGLLVEGFDSAPMVMMPYNPDYYPALIEKEGLSPARDLYAFYMDAENQPPERVKRIVDRVKKKTGITVRSVDMKNLKQELTLIGDLYNSTLSRNWGYVPISSEDLTSTADELKAIVDPSMVMIAEKDGKAVGFSLTFPDINEFLIAGRNQSLPIRVLKFLWKLKTSQPKRARLAVLGVHPEYRNTGIAAVFYYETLVRGKRSYIGGELSWVDEDNDQLMKSIKVMGGERYKTYRIYESPLVQ